LPALAADLVGRRVAVIAAAGGGNSILAAKASTATIPIVFTFGGDPVQEGFVTSLSRPGGNVTGISFFNTLLSAKGLGLLHELVPGAAVIGLLANPRNLESAAVLSNTQEAARTLDRQLIVLNASAPNEIDTAFATMRQRGAGALLVSGDPFYSSRRQQIVALAARDAIPAMYFNREFVLERGLMGYGNGVSDDIRSKNINSPSLQGAGATRCGVLFSGVDNEDDPEGIRLDDHDPVAHDEVTVPAPSGINLHHSRRQHSDLDGSRYDRADVQ
jgi:putative ABC transport system substrate-binding protein